MIISSKKYACETCIKGHRSSSCKHFDRPLFEIKKKGRPVTQCEHCRELRKTKQVHVKCICDGRSEPTPAPKGTKPGFDSAAFPNGLPLHALETSVAPEGFSSDSDMSGGNSVTCQCKETGVCPCCIPRKSRKTNAKFDASADLSVFGDPSRVQSNTAQILARIAELRPVLPRPPSEGSFSNYGDMGYNPPSRYHDNTFSPYERAYGMTHHQPLHVSSSSSHYPGYDVGAHSNHGSSPTSPHAATQESSFFPSVCGCGDNCQCPGCTHHNNTIVSAESAFSTCTNPDNCATCLDCTILSLQNNIDTALSIPQSTSSESSVDEWLRHISSQSSSTADPFTDYTPQSSMWNGGMSNANQDEFVSRMEFDFSTAPDLTHRHVRSSSHTSAADMNGGGLYDHHRGSHDPVPITYPTSPRGGIDFTRSRSVSTSSQSSRQEGVGGTMSGSLQVPYRPTGRVQGLFGNELGSRSTPQLGSRGHRGGGSVGRVTSVSPVPMGAAGYATSNPDHDVSPATSPHDCYDPSLEGLHIA